MSSYAWSYFQKSKIHSVSVYQEHRFSDADGLCISEMASDRSGNERAVRLAKLSKLIQYAMRIMQYFKRMNYFSNVFHFKHILLVNALCNLMSCFRFCCMSLKINCNLNYSTCIFLFKIYAFAFSSNWI